MNIYTVGHSVHSQEYFLKMLSHADIDFVADVRAFPGSRKFPHFKKERMEQWLPESTIAYQHFPLLGGRRTKSRAFQEELNNGWNNQSFHNYADYTLTEDFLEGINELQRAAKKQNVVYFCSERHPSRCHRLLISNWLQVNGWKVFHIIDNSKSEIELVEHELGRWGAMPIIEEDGSVVYPELDS
ncbi:MULTISPECIES: DUF488 family protein [Allobacillus]|uniref:DUF488 domain-containing protein n=1 Tax=Allobacillus salarius TaxID=1955272 RepID=A0A556PM46_9BACI|nr:DUF488 domain-containing protein [Allobacillus salarius]TSJ65463.1 DUF488 domain-containing protein [Allobacillus salarius]